MKKSALYLLLITFIGLSACQKSNAPDPKTVPVTTASITGTIAPLHLASSIVITATNTQTNVSNNAKPDATGVLNFQHYPLAFTRLLLMPYHPIRHLLFR